MRRARFGYLGLLAAAWLLAAWQAAPAGEPAQPKWIWHSAAAPAGRGARPVEARFRREVVIPGGAKVATAVLALTADAEVCRVSVNGTPLGAKRSDWRSVWGVKLGRHLQAGSNVIEVTASKSGGWAGLVGRLTVRFASGAPLEVVTDKRWQVLAEGAGAAAPAGPVPTSPDAVPLEGLKGLRLPAAAAPKAGPSWQPAKELGPLDMPPWKLADLVPAPQPVAWPAAPKNRPLTARQAQELLEADWLSQTGSDPTRRNVLDEIAAARRIAARLAEHPARPSFAAELAELDKLAGQLESVPATWQAAEEVARLYLAVRRVKRRIMFRNPAIDFGRLLLIDGSPPHGHESGHRNTYGGDLARIGGNRIVVLDRLGPGANATDVIPAGSGGVMRMDLAFDCSKLVFAMVPAGGQSFHLYEVSLNADGTPAGPPRQLTNSPYHDIDPIYLPDPNGGAGGRIAFCTTRGNTYVRCLPNSPCSVLARCDADGSNIRIISNNNEPDYTPCLLPDGRILYTRWEYTERPLWRLQALWTMNPDGTGVAHYYGNRSNWPDMLWDARPVPGTDKVMFTGVGHHNVSGGPIGIVDVNEGRDYPDGLYKVTAETPWTEVGEPREGSRIYSPVYRPCPQFGQFASPYPLSDRDFLVSANGRRETGGRDYWLYLMDVDGDRELIYAGTGSGGVWCARPLRPRKKPPVIHDRVTWPAAGEKAVDGVFYSANVYDGAEGLPHGSARFLRVLQQDHKTYSMGYKSFRHSGPVISALQEDAVKRILGTVPIHADGWVSFKAPSGGALYFQLLDANQRCLQIMRSFTGVMPGERRGCLGCHEGHSTTPPGALGARPYEPADIAPPPWGADVSISYERFCQPVLDKYCGKCHQGDGKGRKALDLTLRGGMPERGIDDLRLLPFKEPYMTLVGNTAWTRSPADSKSPGYGLAGALPVEAGGYRHDPYGPIKPMSSLSYTSPLVNLAAGGRHHDVKVAGEDLLRLIAWVDCNCVYRGEEEVRQIPDPDPGQFRGWTVPPRTCTAPRIDRLQPVTDPRPGK